MIYINKRMRIVTGGPNGYLKLETLKQGTKKNGEPSREWVFIGWYANFRNVFAAALRERLFETAKEKLMLEEVCDKVQKAEDEILRAVNSALNPKEDK